MKKRLKDVLEVAEKMFNNRETPEERSERLRQEDRKEARRANKEMAKILLAAVGRKEKIEENESRGTYRERLDKDQCAYCKEKGHWKRECPKIKRKSSKNILLEQEEDID